MAQVVAHIREEYPRPKAAGAGANPDEGYCVGGALLFFMQYPEARGFPDVSQIDNALLKAGVPKNVVTPKGGTLSVGVRIINANDSGNFDKAWQVLEDALAQSDAWVTLSKMHTRCLLDERAAAKAAAPAPAH